MACCVGKQSVFSNSTDHNCDNYTTLTVIVGDVDIGDVWVQVHHAIRRGQTQEEGFCGLQNAILRGIDLLAHYTDRRSKCERHHHHTVIGSN